MKSRFWLVTLFIVSALLLSAYTIDFSTEIESDGSGEMTVTLVFGEDDIEELEDDGDSVEELCEDIEDESDFPRAGSIEYKESRNEQTCIITIPFDDLDELEEIYQEFFGFDVVKLRMNDGELTYEMDVYYYESDDEEATWTVVMPGSVEDSNADDESGRTLTWDLRDGSNEIEAKSSPSSSLLWWVLGIGLACLCGVVVLGGGGAGVFYYMRQKKAGEAGDEVESL